MWTLARRTPVVRTLAMLALAPTLLLAGCYTANQARLGNFVTDTVRPGMLVEQALARMRVEDFYCNASSGGAVSVCTRTGQSLMRGTCVERVDLIRSAASPQLLGAIDILEITCSRK
jgi:hypothetical protein